MFFQRKNSKKEGSTPKKEGSSPKKDKNSRGKSDLLDRTRGGLGAIAGSFRSAKNDVEERLEKAQDDVKTGIETILQRGSEKTEEDIGGHSQVSRSNKPGQGSEEEQGKEDMEAFNSMLDKVKNPDVIEKVNSALEKVKSHPEVLEKIADVLHLGKHGSKEKEPEAEKKTEEGETSADNTEESNILEQAVEEIQTIVASVQPHETARDETAAETETETPAEGDKPEEVNREVEKDNPKNRIDIVGFFAKLFERFCSPADKKKD